MSCIMVCIPFYFPFYSFFFFFWWVWFGGIDLVPVISFILSACGVFSVWSCFDLPCSFSTSITAATTWLGLSLIVSQPEDQDHPQKGQQSKDNKIRGAQVTHTRDISRVLSSEDQQTTPLGHIRHTIEGKPNNIGSHSRYI